MFCPIFPVSRFLSVSILGSERTYANQLSGLNYTLPRHIALHMTVSSLPRTPSQFFSHHTPKNNAVLHGPIFNWITDICASPCRPLFPSFPLFPYLVSSRSFIYPYSVNRTTGINHLHIFLEFVIVDALGFFPKVFRRCHRRSHLAFSLCACRMSFRMIWMLCSSRYPRLWQLYTACTCTKHNFTSHLQSSASIYG